LLLNAEWNKPKDREVNLHRHPAFFGNFEDVIEDCCGFCPIPITPEEKELAEEESKIYVSGRIKFLQDNPGRQEIGSFNPITETDWTGQCSLILWCSDAKLDRNGIRRKHSRLVSSDRRQRRGRREAVAVARL
jgi:hypothetical protein